MTEAQIGKVWLVGAGPGDAGLFTLKGKAVLAQAEVVLYDKLVGPGVLALIPRQAERIDVGKRAGNHPVPQHEINRLILTHALEGKRVVRLKGGDPFLFGRGGEELELLVEHGVPFEIVPGVTSAISVPAYNGIPVTHRDFCSSVHIITGHTKTSGKPEVNFRALAETQGTLVFLMSVSSLPHICRGLTEGGMDPDMPAAVLERGTSASQRRVVSTLAKLPEEAARQGIHPPAIIIVGRVCALADQFEWMERRSLFGLRILVTRPQDSASALTARLSALGAEVVEMPAIRTEAIEETPELTKAFRQISNYGWVVFTSPKGVKVFFQKLKSAGLDIRCLAGLKFAAIGSATKKAIEARGILVDLTPEVYDAAHLGAMLAEQAEGKRVLIPRAKRGTPTLLAELDRTKTPYDDVPIYDTILEEDHPFSVTELFQNGEMNTAAFTSASTVEGFVRSVPLEDYGRVEAICIGEQTAAKCQEYGMKTQIAKQADMDSLTDCVLSYWQARKE